MADETERVTVPLPKDLREKLGDIAFLSRTAEKDLVIHALASYLAGVEERGGEALSEAMQAVRKARGVLES